MNAHYFQTHKVLIHKQFVARFDLYVYLRYSQISWSIRINRGSKMTQEDVTSFPISFCSLLHSTKEMGKLFGCLDVTDLPHLCKTRSNQETEFYSNSTGI